MNLDVFAILSDFLSRWKEYSSLSLGYNQYAIELVYMAIVSDFTISSRRK